MAFPSDAANARNVDLSGTGAGGATDATFVPELWSDEIIASYESNLVLANLVRKMSMKGKKGDLIHVPKPVRADANEKISEAAVTLNAGDASELQIPINRHFEWSMLIEDSMEVQALPSARRFYTQDAGYALAKEVDTFLGYCAVGWGDNDGGAAGHVVTTEIATEANWAHSNAYQIDSGGSTGAIEAYNTTTGEYGAFTDLTMRQLVAQLDDADVPMTNRHFVVVPQLLEEIRGVDQFRSTDFVSGVVVPTGKLGTLYGVDLHVSTNLPNGSTSGVGLDAGVRANLLFHQDAIVLSEQMGVRSQTQYKQEFLADLFTADRLYGAREYRPEAGVILLTLDT